MTTTEVATLDLPKPILDHLVRLGCTLRRRSPREVYKTPAGDIDTPPHVRELSRVRFPGGLVGRPPIAQDAGRYVAIHLRPLLPFELADHKDALITVADGNGQDFYRIDLSEAATRPIDEVPVYLQLRNACQGEDYDTLDECAFADLASFLAMLEFADA